jgi:outer membrane protein assembly factor BamB
MSSIHLAVVALSLMAPAPKGGGAKGDWPQWRGPNRDGHSAATGLLTKWPEGGPKLLWKIDKLGPGFGSPAVAGGRLIVLGSTTEDDGGKEIALCLDPATAKEHWRAEIGAFYNNGWGSGPRSTPTVDGEHVYVLGARGDLHCLNVQDGKKVWSKSLVADFGGNIPNWGYSESVLIDGERLICTPGGAKGTMASLDKKTGEVKWRSEDLKDPAGYASVVPSTGGGTLQYVTQTMQSVCGVRADDGKILWRRTDLRYAVAVIPTPIVYKDHVFVTAGYGAGCELLKLSKDGEGVKAEKVYTSKVITNHHGGVIRVGEHVYGHSDQNSQWVCLEFLKPGSEDGPSPAWTSKKLGKGSVSYADGHLYCYSEDKGELALVKADPEEWKEAGRLAVPEKSKLRPTTRGKVWAHPVIADGKLYLRDYEWLFCYDLTGKD